MWQNIISACHTQRRSCKNGEWKWRRRGRGRGTRRQRRSCVVVNAADNPAHHLQLAASSGSFSLRISIQMQFWKITQNRLATFDGKVRKSAGWHCLTDLADSVEAPVDFILAASPFDCVPLIAADGCSCVLHVACCLLLAACCSLSVVAGVFVYLFWCVLSVGKWSCFADCLAAFTCCLFAWQHLMF